MKVDHYADCLTQLRQFRLIHGGKVQTYTDLAAYIDVALCPSPGSVSGCLVSVADHRRGVASHGHKEVIHWTTRQLTKRGTRQFLKLAASLRVMNYKSFSPAMQLYLANAWATKKAAELHLRLPSRWSQTDRLTVLWLASKGDDITPEARRWASRKETNND